MSQLPIVGVSACFKRLGTQDFHMAGDKYLQAVALGADCLPLVIPALGQLFEPAQLLADLDGLLLTGSPSNVEPLHYQGLPPADESLLDRHRDRLTLPLVRAALDAGVPVLGICRGFQEMNVALGGSLHQHVHEVPGKMDHRENEADPLERQYDLSHPLHVQPGGVLAGLGLPAEIRVNSLHGQGVERLAPGLRVEALAPDGLIEAFSVEGARRFAVGVQWHPEWQVRSNPHYLAIFEAFGRACRERRAERLAS